ncbi:hypothetical protein [Prosthecobacter sp.]|uniref:hypothetical protein n=1 Tax=Prosthecobacter sp. TaxID=1965333 RepID=UPI00248A6AD4|nr:hypothetical protein [Prosthecobacter sp.]MDI1313394.1 hypothetical protein [Prosthecobacter sp.]
MKTLLATLCLLVAISLSAKDLGLNPVFKHYVGNWKAAGELKGENNVLVITEEWSGAAEGDNSFVVKGTRTINGDTQPFQWTITYNEGADSYEAILSGAEGSQTIRFEGHVSEVNLTFELKAITGSGESSITITEAFAGDAKDVMESNVTFTGDSGQTTLQGVIKHQKEKQP